MEKFWTKVLILFLTTFAMSDAAPKNDMLAYGFHMESISCLDLNLKPPNLRGEC